MKSALKEIFLKKKKEVLFTKEEVTDLIESLLNNFDPDEHVDFLDAEMEFGIDWDNRIVAERIDASRQVEDILNAIYNMFESDIKRYEEMKEKWRDINF